MLHSALDISPRRSLGFHKLVALTFFCVAGGAYGLEDAVNAGGPVLALTALLVVPWLWSFPTALMTAELSAAIPEDGGYVVWVQRAFGRFWGFQEGWLSWLCSFADNALYPVMFVDYLIYVIGEVSSIERWLTGVAVMAGVTWLNIRGAQLVGAGSVIFTFLVLAPFVALVSLGAPMMEPSIWLTGRVNPDWPLLLSVILWNTCGWDNAGCCAGEVKRPEKTYPRAMVTAVLLVLVAYLLPVAVGVSADRNWGNWKDGYFPHVAVQIGGGWLGTWLTLAGLVSAVGMANALLCTSSRVPYAMARLGTLPASLAALHPRYSTPWIAILVNSLGISMLIPFSFQDLIQVDMFLYAAALILEFAALVWLRFREPRMPRPYRVPFGAPGTILLSLPPVALCCLSIWSANDVTKAVSLCGIVIGVMVYWLQEKKSLRLADSSIP
ncbi:MAG: APC family permease [Deltaproteobacteria bacterium]|nr:APC family permease [Deltaproteobacteria bacterium]